MSKLYDKYLSLKKENESTLYLFKNGIFYIFLDEDAKKMSSILNLKLTNLNDSVLKCGFPINSSQKYIQMLNDKNYNFKIVENSSKTINTISNNSLNSKAIIELLSKIANTNPDNLSIREVYLFLEDISKQANLILKNYLKED